MSAATEDGGDTKNANQEKVEKSSLERQECFVRLRGIPFNTKEEDVKAFFEGLNVVEITFTQSANGRPSGECYCEFSDPQEAVKALEKDHQEIGNRYIEVFSVGEIEYEQLIKRSELRKMTSTKGFVRLRGLPFNCKQEDIIDFFKDLNVDEVVIGKEPGLEGRPTGDAFVQFSASDEADRAVECSGNHLGSRYIEVFKMDGPAFETFKSQANTKIMPLRLVNPSVDWNYGGMPPPLPGRYPPPQYAGYGHQGAYGGYPQNGYGGGGGRGGKPVQGGGRGGRPIRGTNRYKPYGNGGSSNGAYLSYGNGGAENDGSTMRNDYGGGVMSYGGGASFDHSASKTANPNVSPTKVYVRGLPFRITVKEIENFFAPLQCISVALGTLENGRASGDGIIGFSTPQEAQQAMLKDRQNIGSRYVEIFPTTRIKIPSSTTYEEMLKGGGDNAVGAVTTKSNYLTQWDSASAYQTVQTVTIKPGGVGGQPLQQPATGYDAYAAAYGAAYGWPVGASSATTANAHSTPATYDYNTYASAAAAYGADQATADYYKAYGAAYGQQQLQQQSQQPQAYTSTASEGGYTAPAVYYGNGNTSTMEYAGPHAGGNYAT